MKLLQRLGVLSFKLRREGTSWVTDCANYPFGLPVDMVN